MEKLVGYTGSFCPVTKAHAKLLTEAMRIIGASKGFFLPTCDKNIRNKLIKKRCRLILKGDVRVKMLEAASKDIPNVYVSDYEIRIKDSNNTYKTFKYLKEQNPGYELYYLMGADKLNEIPRWKNTEKFLNEFKFVVFDRSDMDANKMIDNDPLLSQYKDNFVIIDPLDGLSEVSSTNVREMFLNNDPSYKDVLNDGVSKILEELDLNDYPEIDDYDIINSDLGKGPFDKKKAYKRVYELNSVLFKENSSLAIKNDIELFDLDMCGRIEPKFKTEVKFENSALDTLVDKYNNLLYIAEGCSYRTARKYDQGDNFTTEEELCRTTNLSQALFKHGILKQRSVKMSGLAIDTIYPLEKGIYLKGIKLIRHGEDNDYRLLDNFNKEIDIIDLPCISLIENDNKNNLEYKADGRLNVEGTEIIKNRLRSALYLAYLKGYESVCINAFGTGFKIPFIDSALILNDVLKEFNGVFKYIIINQKLGRYMKNEFLPNFKGVN